MRTGGGISASFATGENFALFGLGKRDHRSHLEPRS